MPEQYLSLLKPRALKLVHPNKILPNPNNPRLFFPEESLKVLKESISMVGILVPLVVYWSKADKKFRLLDGERRWKCAVDLKLKTVPVNVVREPNNLQNIITMFNIHKLREDWELAPTALKLELLIRILSQQLKRKRIGVVYLHKVTGLSTPTVKRCVILLSFDKPYQDMMIAREEERIKTDFFIELYPVLTRLANVFPDIFERYGKNGIVDRLLAKYKSGVIKNVVDFRKVTEVVGSQEKGVPESVIRKALEMLLDDPAATIQSVYAKQVDFVYEFERITKRADEFVSVLREFTPHDEQEARELKDFLVRVVKELQERISRLG